MSSVPTQSGPTSADIAGNGWLPKVPLIWTWNRENLDAQKKKARTSTDARHGYVAIKKPGP